MVSQRICTHILFFATHKATAEKIKRECKLPHGDTANLNRQTFERKEERTDNSTYKKLAVQWLNDPDSYRDCASYQILWWQTV